MTHNLLPGKKVIFQGKEVTDYPYVVIWEKSMGAQDYYIEAALAEARRDAFTPPNATSKRGGKWNTLNGINNPDWFIRNDVPLPERLNYTVQITVHRHFDTEEEAHSFRDNAVESLGMLGGKTQKATTVIFGDNKSHQKAINEHNARSHR